MKKQVLKLICDVCEQEVKSCAELSMFRHEAVKSIKTDTHYGGVELNDICDDCSVKIIELLNTLSGD